MSTEFWVYGISLVIAVMLVWRFGMQYHSYLEQTCEQSELARQQLRRYLGADSVRPRPIDPEPDDDVETPAEAAEKA